MEIVVVELHVGLQDGGLNEQETPEGRFEHENDIDCVEPEVKVVVTVVVVELPCVIEAEAGEIDTEKSNG